ncbi:MAG: cytochrome c3 family protein [Thermodesulfobacteriota bacterium]|nr:MAG: cytochrome c3 family protein [Thermodesulfobacteriota bacterium]
MKARQSFILLAFLLAGPLTSEVAFAESKFMKSFRTSYEQNRFDALGFLVKTNKDIIPGEIRSLLDEARAAEGFEKKMAILDLAATMATMYGEWHGQDGFIGEIEAMQKEEMGKEEERKAELEKWKKYEAFPGNLLMREKAEAAGMAPVIFPHWVHRINFECKACHPAPFEMKKTGSIGMTEIFGGGLCGKCHNGTTAFSAAEDCERCHSVGTPGEAHLLDPKKAYVSKLKETSERLGTGLNLDLLPGKALPYDRFGNIDWGLLGKARKPIKSIEGAPADKADETRDNEILFESPMPYVNNVVFSHKTHSERVVCSSCHQSFFKDQLGANTASMKDMAEGASCGACHQKVAFKFADCNRCHSRPVAEDAGGALKRK